MVFKKLMPAICVPIVFLCSCLSVSLDDRLMSSLEVADYRIVGEVTAQIGSPHILLIRFRSNENAKKKAYEVLLEEAKRNYSGKYGHDKIDVKNIRLKGTAKPMTFWKFFYYNIPVQAKGDAVVKEENFDDNLAFSLRGMDGTIYRIVQQLILSGKTHEGSTLAILSVSSASQAFSESIISELEYNLVNTGLFKIADRRQLDEIRKERDFHTSGEVSDDSAVSIGKVLGATVVITGEFNDISKRLTIRLLDVETGQILAMFRDPP